MKRFIVMISLFAQILVAGTAMAVTVDFSGITTGQDITTIFNADGTTTESPYTINGVTFRYDGQGSAADFASIDSAGIFGTTAGTLILDFAIPATALNFNFMLQDAFSDAGALTIQDALVVSFFKGGNFLDSRSETADFFAYDSGDPTLGSATGALAYSGLAFDQAQMFFSFNAPFFTVDNVSYEPVPEPGTIMLLSAGLFGLAVYGRRRMES